jgi:hypothetical protein
MLSNDRIAAGVPVLNLSDTAEANGATVRLNGFSTDPDSAAGGAGANEKYCDAFDASSGTTGRANEKGFDSEALIADFGIGSPPFTPGLVRLEDGSFAGYSACGASDVYEGVRAAILSAPKSPVVSAGDAPPPNGPIEFVFRLFPFSKWVAGSDLEFVVKLKAGPEFVPAGLVSLIGPPNLNPSADGISCTDVDAGAPKVKPPVVGGAVLEEGVCEPNEKEVGAFEDSDVLEAET